MMMIQCDDDDDTIRRGEKEDPTTGADPRKLVGSRHHLRQSRTGLREQRIYFSIRAVVFFNISDKSCSGNVSVSVVYLLYTE